MFCVFRLIRDSSVFRVTRLGSLSLCTSLTGLRCCISSTGWRCGVATHDDPLAFHCLVPVYLLGTNLSEWLNIQKRESPSSGPSLTNSWPRPLPHLPHNTLNAVSDSIILVTLSSLRVSVKAGHGEEWANFDLLENSGWLHWEHTYIPGLKWSL